MRRWPENLGPDRTGKFGLRTGVRTVAPSRKRLRTGPDWESSDFGLSPNFRAAEKKPGTGSDWESPDFGLSPNFGAAEKKLRTGSDWGSSDFGLSPNF